MKRAFAFWSLILLDGIRGQTVVTIAGTGVRGYQDGPASSATFTEPSKIVPDPFGNFYIIDQKSGLIRFMNGSNYVTTLAGQQGVPGSNDGQGTTATFKWPFYGVTDREGNLILTDHFDGYVRKVTSTGLVTTVASGLYLPAGITWDPSGNLIIADREKIYNCSLNGQKQELAGSEFGTADGQGSTAQFGSAHGIAFDATGNLLIADNYNNAIRMMNRTNYVSTISGGTADYQDGQSRSALFRNPNDVAIDQNGTIFISDEQNFRIRMMNSSGFVSTYAGNSTKASIDGVGTLASFTDPTGLSFDSSGNLLVADRKANLIRKICPNICQPGNYIMPQSPNCCAPCPSGTYQPQSSQWSCIPCPVNATCSSSAVFLSSLTAQSTPSARTSSAASVSSLTRSLSTRSSSDVIVSSLTPSQSTTSTLSNAITVMATPLAQNTTAERGMSSPSTTVMPTPPTQNTTVEPDAWLLRLLITVLIGLFGFLFICQLAFMCGYICGGRSDKWMLRRYFGSKYMTESV